MPRRSRPLPTETVLAVAVVALTLLAGLFVVVQDTMEGEALLATRSDSVPDTTTPTLDAPTTTAPERQQPVTSTPSVPEPTPATTAPATTTTTAPEPDEEPAPACAGLASQSFWVDTGDRSTLEAAAGTSATYVEVVTNRSEEPCTLATNRCGSTAVLQMPDGSPTDAPDESCPSVHTEAELEPGEQRREELTIDFPVPPGEYEALVRRYDGTSVVLPVRLDDRVPTCPAHRLSLRVNGGEQFRDRQEVSERGLVVDLIVAGADEACSVRVVESRLLLVSPAQRAALVDRTERWSVPPAGEDVRTHVVAPPTDLRPAEYDATVTLLLADGGQLTAPFRLLVG